MSDRYKKSEALLERAQVTIPLGSQTFSKSKTQFPYGVSPYFIERGKGCHVWDVDGNEYIDFVNGLASVSIGYNEPEITRAVQKQIENGVTFSLSHRLEVDVSELLVELVPCAEMVRFGKNGSDATSAAIRLARAHTKKEHIAVCGYHGWHDWYIGSTARDLGVPISTQKLTHAFTYNDIDSLKKIFVQYPNDIAAVILEPMNLFYPKEGFLEAIKQVTHANGALLVFDETVTGCRFSKGGAQEYFGITPDLATFGKGLANGFPLSAVVGKKEIMMLMADIFYSGTFGGETASLASAKAVLLKIKQEPILETIAERGRVLLKGTDKLINKYNLEHIFSTAGHPSWSFLLMNDVEPYSVWEIKTLFLQEMFARGVLTIGSHNLSYAHTEKDIERLLEVYDEVLPLVGQAIKGKTLLKQLNAEPLKALFKVR